LFAALNSLEAASLPWTLFRFSGNTTETPGRKHIEQFREARRKRMDAVLAEREWLAGIFRCRYFDGPTHYALSTGSTD
jgi:glutathione S-transferase